MAAYSQKDIDETLSAIRKSVGADLSKNHSMRVSQVNYPPDWGNRVALRINETAELVLSMDRPPSLTVSFVNEAVGSAGIEYTVNALDFTLPDLTRHIVQSIQRGWEKVNQDVWF